MCWIESSAGRAEINAMLPARLSSCKPSSLRDLRDPKGSQFRMSLTPLPRPDKPWFALGPEA